MVSAYLRICIWQIKKYWYIVPLSWAHRITALINWQIPKFLCSWVLLATSLASLTCWKLTMRNHDFIEDQAAGLRRIMAGPIPRVITVISALNSDCHKEQPRLLSNLAASLILQGSEVLIMQTGPETREATIQYSLNQAPTLIDVAMQKMTLSEMIHLCGDRKYEDGCYIAKLNHKSRSHPAFDGITQTALNQTFSQLASHYDVILVDTVLNKQHALPLSVLNQHEIVIHLTQQPESIKQ